MESIHAGFQPGGELHAQLDGSTFRPQNAGDSLRLRSWAIHDGVLDEPYSSVTMYKVIGQKAETNTAPGAKW
jgi:acetoin utilization protein AcuC